MAVKVFSDDTFTQDTANGVVLVDFWAEWCGPCRLIAPIVEELANELPQVTFGKLNVDENQQSAQNLGITSIPTLIIYKNGEIVEKMVGMLPKPQLKTLMEKYI
jgi:thioredoxin 1